METNDRFRYPPMKWKVKQRSDVLPCRIELEAFGDEITNNKMRDVTQNSNTDSSLNNVELGESRVSSI